MKKMFVAFCAVVLSMTAPAQTNNFRNNAAHEPHRKAGGPIEFAAVKHDFGKIRNGIPVKYEFVFQNVSNKPVAIEQVKASCGCTTPRWPEAPVERAHTGKISVGFNAASFGPFYKVIYVKVAGREELIELHITGEVLKAEDVTVAKR